MHATLSGKYCQILYARAYSPGLLFDRVNSSIYLENAMTEDQMNVAMLTFQTCKILPPPYIINPCARFWHVISLQSHGCTPQTKPPGSCFIFSPVPVATQPLVVFWQSAIFGLYAALHVRPGRYSKPEPRSFISRTNYKYGCHGHNLAAIHHLLHCTCC